MDWSLFENVIDARSLDEVRDAAARFCRSAGFEHHGFAMRRQPSMLARGQDGFLTFNNYGNEWGAHYLQLRVPNVAAADARVGHSRTSLPAVTWNTHGEVAYTSSRHRKLWGEGQRMMALAGESGIRGGISAPCRVRGLDWGFLSVSTDRTHEIRELIRPVAELSYFVSCMEVALEKTLESAAGTLLPRESLSLREREVLGWCTTGKTSWEIGVILGITERTVNFHVYQAADKLGTRGRQSTVARAVALGLVQP